MRPIAGAGFEPTTFGLWARRATRLLHPAIILCLVSLPKENVGFEPTRRFLDLTVFKTVPFSQTWVILHHLLLDSRPAWTLLDSNQRPDGYEPSALTN